VRKGLLKCLLLLALCVGCHRQDGAEDIEKVLDDGILTVTDVRFRSSAINSFLWYRIIVPKVGSNERLPVLYLLHGANSDPRDVTDRSDIVKMAGGAHLVVVIPNGDYSYYTNAKHKRNARWEDMMTEELPQDVQKQFPVLASRAHTGIAGISMGGYGAMKLALKHPDLYGFAGSLSGALDITRRKASLRRWGQTWRIWTIFGLRPQVRQDEDVFDLLNHGAEVRNTTWFVSCGRSDSLFAVMNDSHASCVNAGPFWKQLLPLVATIGKVGTQRCRTCSGTQRKPSSSTRGLPGVGP
jgi:putative tributyrin esterase